MVERATIRPSKPVYERLNERRSEHGETWDEFFARLLDNGEGAEESYEEQAAEYAEMTASLIRDTGEDGAGHSKQLDRIEELVRNIPDRTANEVEGRMSRR